VIAQCVLQIQKAQTADYADCADKTSPCQRRGRFNHGTGIEQNKQRFFLCDLCVLLFNFFLLVDAIRRNSWISSVSDCYPRNPRPPRSLFLAKSSWCFAVGFSIAFAVFAASPAAIS
jgi:hypothetical protein